MHRIQTILSLCLVVAGCTSTGNGPSNASGAGAGGAASGTGGRRGAPEGGTSEGGASAGSAGESGSSDGGASDAGTSSTIDAPNGGAAEGGAPGTCGTLANTASIVSKTANPGAQPPMTGGQLLDGTYEKTSIVDYQTSSPGTTKHQETWLISGSGSVFHTVSQNPADMIEKRFGATITTSGGALTLNLNCPEAHVINAQYTATPNEIRFSNTANEVHVYTRVGAGAGGAGGASNGGAGGGAGTSSGAGSGGSAGVAGSGSSAGSGPALETIATSLSDVVDLDLDSDYVYALGNGEVRRCALSGCGSNSTLVVSGISVASSLAVSQGTLFVGNGFRYLSSCTLGSSCTLAPFYDVGQNSYPSQIWIANSRIYWVSETGSARRIQVCPLAGCSAGYPKFVYQGSLLNGVSVNGLVVDAANVHVLSFTGGLFQIPLTDAETANATAAVQLSATDYGSGGLDLDGLTLRWANAIAGKLETCMLPGCSALSVIKGGLAAPSAVRTNASHVYGISRGTSNGSGGYLALTGSIWRYPR